MDISHKEMSTTDISNTKVINNSTTSNNDSTGQDITDDFLWTWFPQFPSDIIEHVCKYLYSETVKDTLLKAPRLRSAIIDIFYREELYLNFSPANYTQYLWHNIRDELKYIASFKDIADFLKENPDINPEVLKLEVRGDLSHMYSFFSKFSPLVKSTTRLEIHIEKYQLTSEDLQRIFAFRNLCKLDLTEVSFLSTPDQFPALLEQSKSIKELALHEHRVYDWTDMKLPADLMDLEVSFQILPGDRVIDNLVCGVFDVVAPHRSLRFLKILFSDLTTLNVSQLPASLETIDLRFSKFEVFQGDGNLPCWPPRVKSIKLAQNYIDDASMKQLSAIAWPPSLETLDLGYNSGVTSLEYLCNLPSSLKHLDLSNTNIRSLRVKHNADNYPFFKFPEFLKTLNLEMSQVKSSEFEQPDWDPPDFVMEDSEASDMETSDIEAASDVPSDFEAPDFESSDFEMSDDDILEHEHIHLEERVQFPPTLKELDLSSFKDTRLACFVFPPSLEKLDLRDTDIADLTTYNLTVGSDEIVNWKHLTNLKELDLSRNQIGSLENWCPPESLRVLWLARNAINRLTGFNTPLFNENFQHYTNNIVQVSFEKSQIEDIDNDLVLPPNLKFINLASNKFKEFVFTDAIACHPKLTAIDLRLNIIERISVEVPEKRYNSKLRFLTLFLCQLERFQMTKEEVYKVFDQLGLVVAGTPRGLVAEYVFKENQEDL